MLTVTDVSPYAEILTILNTFIAASLDILMNS